MAIQISPQSKSITVSIDSLATVEIAIQEIEKIALEDESITGEVARGICGELRLMRAALSLKPGVTRHEKWAPELQKQSKSLS